MGHNQLFEFIDIFQMYHCISVGGTGHSVFDMNRYIGNSKTYLHLAVE